MVIAVDLGGTNIRAGRVDNSQVVVQKYTALDKTFERTGRS
jgi:predicted NBD/HSP70 family sugar kinase